MCLSLGRGWLEIDGNENINASRTSQSQNSV
jgi:hypothetical protein